MCAGAWGRSNLCDVANVAVNCAPMRFTGSGIPNRATFLYYKEQHNRILLGRLWNGSFFLLYTFTCVCGICPVNRLCCSSIVDHRCGRLPPATSARWANKPVSFDCTVGCECSIAATQTIRQQFQPKKRRAAIEIELYSLMLKAVSRVSKLAASLSLSCFRFFTVRIIKQLDQRPNMEQTRMQTLFVLVYERLSHPLLPSVSRRVCKLPLSGFNLHFFGHGRTTSYPSPSCALLQGLAAEPSLDLLLLEDVCLQPASSHFSVCLSL